MEKEFIVANLNWTAVQCIEEIRRQREKVEKVYSIYVTGEDNRLLGRISLKRLILAPDNALVSDFMEEAIYVDAFMEEEEVAKAQEEAQNTKVTEALEEMVKASDKKKKAPAKKKAASTKKAEPKEESPEEPASEEASE